MDARSMSLAKGLTRSLLSVVGSPFNRVTELELNQDLSSLYRYAARNRMALLCLDALHGKDINVFSDDRKKFHNIFLQTLDLVVRVSSLLERAGVDCVLFKTLRPYREATVDIDILTLGSSYGDALKAMNGAGYLLLERGPLSATFRDPVSRLGVDIHDEIGVSHLVYLDKGKLGKQVVRREVPGGIVRTLSPAADLLVIISHSVLKEQMYVLSEYYSTLFYLHGDPSGTIATSLRILAERCKLELALKIHLGITASLHRDVHGFVPRCIKDASDDLEVGSWEFSRTKKLGVGFPLKYHPMTTARALAGLLKEPKGRRSVALQALKMFDPHSSLRVAGQLFRHITRETY